MKWIMISALFFRAKFCEDNQRITFTGFGSFTFSSCETAEDFCCRVTNFKQSFLLRVFFQRGVCVGFFGWLVFSFVENTDM